MNAPTTLLEATRYFADADTCLEYMVNIRWPNGVVVCPTCDRTDANFLAARRVWQCKSKHAKRQFSVKV
ncbi:MAG: transposase, partial [Dehalococcoidia bacterium]|nr:transposase [Dehalococcoidia bacterium]